MGIKERADDRKKRIVANMARNFKDAENWDLYFWQDLSPEQRLSALVAIRKDIEKVVKARSRSLDVNKNSL